MPLTKAYNSGLHALTSGAVAWESADVYAIIVSGYTFNKSHTTYANVSAAELDDAGDYAPKAVTGKSVGIVLGSGEDPDVIRYDSDNVSFGTDVSIGPADGIVFLAGNAAAPDAADPVLLYGPLPEGGSLNSTFSVSTADGVYDIKINS